MFKVQCLVGPGYNITRCPFCYPDLATGFQIFFELALSMFSTYLVIAKKERMTNYALLSPVRVRYWFPLVLL